LSTGKKILFITLRSDYGGGPFHVDVLINQLFNSFNLYCAAPADKPYGEKWKSKLGIEHFFELPHRSFSIIRFLQLLAIIRREKIKIIHAHGHGAGIYARLLKIFSPGNYLIYTFHGLHIRRYSRIGKWVYIIVERFFSRFTDLYINVSLGEKENCIRNRLFDEEKSIVLYNALDIPAAEFKKKDHIRQLLQLPVNKFIVISLVRFDYAKNCNGILDIAKKMISTKNLMFILIGEGEEKKQIEDRILNEAILNVVLTGYKGNTDEYLLASDICLSTSRWEGLPYSLIEAARAGLPIIASNVTGNNEVVVDGFNGYLFDLDDLEVAVNQIMHLYNSKSDMDNLGLNSKIQFEKNFLLENLILKIKEIYLNLP